MHNKFPCCDLCLTFVLSMYSAAVAIFSHCFATTFLRQRPILST